MQVVSGLLLYHAKRGSAAWISGSKKTLWYLKIDKGKSIERWRRKATSLKQVIAMMVGLPIDREMGLRNKSFI